MTTGIAELKTENQRLRDALADALDFIRGDITGSAQRLGILREGSALITSGESVVVSADYLAARAVIAAYLTSCGDMLGARQIGSGVHDDLLGPAVEQIRLLASVDAHD